MNDKKTRMVECQKLNKTCEGLRRPPVPGELGKKIYTSISKEAWQQWLGRQTMFINEYRLNLTDSEAKKFLNEQMEAFLFDDQDAMPEGYTATDDK
jgi:Fe-S cluster biosynthesis and repair protein YggX